ncbi:hypothetical protein [Mesorhizobium sp. LjNodule214]|uniref:hypothetical protein n=1 Tax=Mesorhizobium sp. LjNodule214 TaxID=3342252 RepID=UPI003ED13A0C
MTLPHSAFCACCNSPSLPVPAQIWNRPGLSALSFRIGTFATFRETMLEAISDEPALSVLTTRESSDYAITLIELFAAVGDVLTFYNERIANELYLRTARERDSVLRLIRLLGYRMRPGLAAQTMLAFTLDAGAETRIRKGLKVMSVPGQDERPQTFETVEQILAHADINDLGAFGQPSLFNALRTGGIGGPLISRPAKLAVSDRLVLFGLSAIEEKTVAALSARADGEAIAFDPPVQAQAWWLEVTRAAKLEGRLRFFGHNAPAKVNIYVPASPPTVLWPKWTSETVNASFGAADTVYPLDGRYTDIAPGSQLLIDAGPGSSPRLRSATVSKTEDLPTSLKTLEDTVTHLHLRQTIRGCPAVVSQPTGGHAVFARSGTSTVLALGATGPRQWTYHNLDGASSGVTGTGTAVGRTDIFVRDNAARLRQRVLLAGAVLPWVNHGGILTSEPRPVMRPGGNVTVFVRGLDLGLWSLDATSGTPGSWVSLGGILTSAPAPVASGGSALAVFVRGLDRALWYRSWNGIAWADWAPLKGVLATVPAAASTGAGRIDVVALDDAGSLIHRLHDSSDWSDWRNLGGKLEGDLAIVGGNPDRIDVFAKGVDGGLWHISRNGAAWSGWTAHGGALTSAPAAARDGTGVHVYARGGDGAVAYRALLAGGWGQWASLGEGIGSVPDRRKTAIYRISAEDVVFRDYEYPTAASQGQFVLRLSQKQKADDLGGLEKLAKGRRIMLRSGDRNHLATVSAATLRAAIPGNLPDHLFVDFTPVLSEPFENARLVGNIAAASHGETQPDEPLGHGEAAKAFQKFRLSRPALTYLQNSSKLEGEAALELRVNSELWKEVPSLYGRKSGERVYTARQSVTGETQISIGDGKTGARAASGAVNVIARYRTGLGLEGLMKAGQLSIPLERPVGLRTVSNPLPADGAADPESRDNARASAPNTVRTFGRAVSLADFEYIATSSGLAQRAFVTWVWRELERAVHVTVAGPGGIKLSSLSLSTLHASLETARDTNRPLFLANLVRVPVVVSARILRDPAYEADSVLEAARTQLLALLAFETTCLGEAAFLSGVYAALHGGKGVAAVDIDLFQLKDYADLTATERAIRAVTADPVQPHIRIFPARPTPPAPMIDRFARAGFEGPVPPLVLAAEQAFIENPATDIKLTVVEAL